MSIKVTEWRHSSTDSFLVLEGTAKETSVTASQYFNLDEGDMEPMEIEMDEDEFRKLPEFEG